MSKELKRIYNVGLVVAVILGLFLLTLSINELKKNRYIGSENPNTYTISVTGEGEAFAVPDTAKFTFTVEEEAETISIAQASVAQTVNEILDLLDDEGISEKNIKTLGYNSYPRYEYRNQNVVCTSEFCPPRGEERVLVGYVVSHNLEVKVEDEEKAGEIIGQIGNMEVDYISGLNFVVEDESQIRNEARGLAIEDARQKAEVLADQLGVSLGSVVSFSESGQPTPFYAYEGLGGAYDEARAESAPKLPSGENKVVSRVNIVYQIR